MRGAQASSASGEAQRRLRRAAALLLSAVLLIACFAWAGVEQTAASLSSLKVEWIAVGLALSVPQIFLSALRWKTLADALGDRLPLTTAWREYYRSFFLNQVLPLGIMGDALRVRRQSKRTQAKRSEQPQAAQSKQLSDKERAVGIPRALAGVALERAVGQAVLFFVFLATLPLWSPHAASSRLQIPLPSGGSTIATVLIAAGLAVAFFLAVRRSRRAMLALAEGKSLLKPRLLATQVATSAGILLTLVLQYVATTQALALPIKTADAALFALPTLGVAALPFVTAGWGSREAFGAALFMGVGLAASDGVAVGVVFGGLQLVSALPGLVFVLLPEAKEAPHGASAPAVLDAEQSGARFSVGHAGWVLACSAASLAVESAGPLAVGGTLSLLLYLARGQLDSQQIRWGRANLVTLFRLALVASLGLLAWPGWSAALLVLVVLSLDGLDGHLARRHNQVSPLGARFDMETDALLVLLAGYIIYFAGHLGAFILIPGALRYVYVLAMATGAFEEAPPSRIGRAVFVVVALALVVSLWPLAPLHRPIALLATALLVYSFARSVRWSVSA
jgi:phosphatidylglycerophosphate synthase